ncbi:proline racemase family protein [Citricoccus nitrophenolicus]|uniref:Proline racemase family protein n=1 Tax=Citricoccus nitrophenolicus TaxID=863575 RepID=A0ABV0IMD0_9MICC
MARQHIDAVDYHAAGEPFRIVHAGRGAVPDLPGATVADRREAAQAPGAEIDRFRRLLVREPRGHRDMYGGFIVPPNPVQDGDAAAEFGVVFWHQDGYSTACGHGTMALGAWAVETGLVPAPAGGNGAVTVRIDVPSGRVEALVRVLDGGVADVEFVNVPSFSLQLDVTVATSRGEVTADLSWGGAVYAEVHAADLGLGIIPDHYAELVAIGREIKWALNDHPAARCAYNERFSGVYGTILFDRSGGDPLHQRNLVVFADGQADRSPCGSGMAARCATLSTRGLLRPGQTLRHDSIIGTTFTATIEELPDGVRPHIVGRSTHTATTTFVVDDRDELPEGLTLR